MNLISLSVLSFTPQAALFEGAHGPDLGGVVRHLCVRLTDRRWSRGHLAYAKLAPPCLGTADWVASPSLRSSQHKLSTNKTPDF